MRHLALALLVATGCAAAHEHPFTAAALVNSTVVVGAGVCALDCGHVASDVADGVLIGELAVSSIAAVWFIEWIAAESSR